MKISSITSAHIRAARGFLAISQTDLAVFCGLSRTTIKDIEAGRVLPRKSGDVITGALAELGVRFTENGLTVET